MIWTHVVGIILNNRGDIDALTTHNSWGVHSVETERFATGSGVGFPRERKSSLAFIFQYFYESRLNGDQFYLRGFLPHRVFLLFVFGHHLITEVKREATFHTPALGK